MAGLQTIQDRLDVILDFGFAVDPADFKNMSTAVRYFLFVALSALVGAVGAAPGVWDVVARVPGFYRWCVQGTIIRKD